MDAFSGIGKSAILQSRNLELNASFTTADELSKELGSMWEECSASNEATDEKGTYPDYKASPVNSGENPDTVSYSSRMKDQQMTSDTSPASKSLPFSPSGQLSQDQSPKPLDSISSSKYTPTFYYTSERQTPPLGQHERSPSPSPRSVISEIHNYDQMSPVQSSRFFAQTQKKSSSSQSLQYDTGSLGRSSGWSPQKERSPSPHPASVVPQEFAATPRQSKPLVSSTLPRNFREIKTYDDVQAPQKPTGIWNESNLDVAYEKRSHQKPGYERLDKLRPNPPPSVLVSNWRESNLDAPPSAVKDSLPSNPEYGSLPRMTRKPIPGEWQYNSLPMRTTGYPPSPGFQYGQQPIISRINVPPQFQKGTLSGPLPLSVIMRLQSPFWNSSYSIPQRASDGGSVPARNAPLLQPHMPQQMPPTEKAQPAKEGGVAGKGLPPAIPPASDAGDIEPELEHLGEVVGEPIEQVPRPLSPTRLQPVLPHIDEKEPEMQEVLRIRAEIPRALKKRTSVDSTISGPLLPPSHRKQYQQIINKLFRRRVSKKDLDVNEDTIPEDDVLVPPVVTPMPVTLETEVPAAKPQRLHSILKKTRIEKVCSARRARLSPLVLLLDAALVGDLDTVQKSVWELTDPSQPNDEGITALHNAICAGQYLVVEFLIRSGANVNAPDSHGWTPLHCAASCNDRQLCEFLVRSGAAIMAVTDSDNATAAQKCDPFAPNFEECSQYLAEVESSLGKTNSGVVYALWNNESQNLDELSFRDGDMVTILQRDDDDGWWMASLCGREGLVPKNYFGLFPRVRPKTLV
ncbi:relA-associated inhibitor [Polypterus senegalus]|uniref:relA-associated inhibitor n=1 Tax=Polypterus senegalus TaxID=55291 RepID=UPI0019661B0A|nr:relA-associated inhibitor [Polypterus senegalus]